MMICLSTCTFSITQNALSYRTVILLETNLKYECFVHVQFDYKYFVKNDSVGFSIKEIRGTNGFRIRHCIIFLRAEFNSQLHLCVQCSAHRLKHSPLLKKILWE
jgi:hypothetical protein